MNRKKYFVDKITKHDEGIQNILSLHVLFSEYRAASFDSLLVNPKDYTVKSTRLQTDFLHIIPSYRPISKLIKKNFTSKIYE